MCSPPLPNRRLVFYGDERDEHKHRSWIGPRVPLRWQAPAAATASSSRGVRVCCRNISLGVGKLEVLLKGDSFVDRSIINFGVAN